MPLNDSASEFAHEGFATTTRGLDREHPALRFFEKSKRYGIWNPSDIDFSQDIEDWRALKDDEKDLVLRLTAQFQSGEEAVTLDLLPLINAVSAMGRIEEEMYLTAFLFEEAKHTDFFDRVLREVMGGVGDLSRYHSPSYRAIFYEALPKALRALRYDTSPIAMARASTTYNMIVEGVLAETGYHSYYAVLERQNKMPGLRSGLLKLRQDEARHIAFGIYFLSRLISEYDEVYDVIQETLAELMIPAVGIVDEAFASYPDPVPFNLDKNEFTDFAQDQFMRRCSRLDRARGASLGQVYTETRAVLDAEEV